MALIDKYPTSYYPASHSGIYDQIVNEGGVFDVPDDPVNDPYGAKSRFKARDLFAPWYADCAIDDIGNFPVIILIVNDTGSELTLSGTTYYDGGTLISQPQLPDDRIGVIPAGYNTDRGTYLGMGRFVQGYGSAFFGAGAALIFDTALYGVPQSFGIFVATSAGGSGGFGLDICADMEGVDPKTRFDAGAWHSNTAPGTCLHDTKKLLDLRATIVSRATDEDLVINPGLTDLSPLVLVELAGAP